MVKLQKFDILDSRCHGNSKIHAFYYTSQNIPCLYKLSTIISLLFCYKNTR